MTFIPATDFLIEVAKGNVTGHAIVNKFGRNPDIDTASDPEDVWDGGGVWAAPTTARTHQIASTDDEDGGAGTDTGALTIRVFGLDAAFALQQEDVTMNGTSNVATANTYTMIYRMQVLTAGSTGNNIGIITATADTDATVTAQINATRNQTLMAIYQIPAGKTGYLLQWSIGVNKATGAAGNVDITFVAKPDGAVFQVKRWRSLGTAAGPSFIQTIEGGVAFAAKTIIKIQVVTVSANDMDVSGDFDLLLVDD